MSIDQARITDLHRSAMRLAHEAADTADPALARQIYSRAFEKEREAAALLASTLDVEPTRAVLHRSAASLGMNSWRLIEAYAVLIDGLASGSAEVEAELRKLQRELDSSLAARMSAADARRELIKTWNPRDWRERMPEILAVYLGNMDRYLDLNGFSTEESKKLALLALARLHASDVQLADVEDLELALFDLLRDLVVEKVPRRDPPV